MFTGFGGSLDLAAILDFADSGHDVIVAADENASDLIRNIAAECGVDFDEVCFDFLDSVVTGFGSIAIFIGVMSDYFQTRVN